LEALTLWTNVGSFNTVDKCWKL